MFRNYVLVTVRNLRKRQVYTGINIFGLAVGIALCMLMLMYVNDEFSYDSYHDNLDGKYRLVMDFNTSGNTIEMATTSVPAGPRLVSEYPEVTGAVRLQSLSEPLFNYANDTYFYETDVFYADAGVFDFFTIPLLQGDRAACLQQPNSLVLTASAAQKYFGNADPVGKTLTMQNSVDYTVAGIVENPPENTHFSYNILLSRDFDSDSLNFVSRWATGNIYTYLSFMPGTDISVFSEKLDNFIERNAVPELSPINATIEYTLQPLKDIYLTGEIGNELGAKSSTMYSYAFTTMAIFVLLIASINFMNLATARSAGRAREVGMRKVLGAYRGQLIVQFLGESALLTFLAFFLGIAIVAAILPEFNALAGKNFSLSDLAGFRWNWLIPLTVLAVGLLSGSYPALFLSSFRPVVVLKGGFERAGRGLSLRRVLVVFQFSLSIMLIIGTIVIFKQQRFLMNKDLGFDPEQLMLIEMRSGEQRRQIESFKNTLVSLPGVVNATSCTYPPGSNSAQGLLYLPEGADESERTVIYTNVVDFDFIKTYGFELVAGRDFSPDLETDRGGTLVINEATARRFNWQEPVGKRLNPSSSGSGNLEVIGVVRDYHHFTAQQEITPYVFVVQDEGLTTIALRLSTSDLSETLLSIESAWNTFAPGYPFEYEFTDDTFAESYRDYATMGKLIGYFSALAVLIACLGLFGLASFTAERRTREIGIRKVLGATAPGIVLLLCREFLKSVLFANIIAWPAAYIFLDRWLQDFAYRTAVGFEVFAAAGALALCIALLTVGFQVLRAALLNPAQAIRYE